MRLDRPRGQTCKYEDVSGSVISCLLGEIRSLTSTELCMVLFELGWHLLLTCSLRVGAISFGSVWWISDLFKSVTFNDIFLPLLFSSTSEKTPLS